MFTIPNVLSALRLALVPVLLWVAWIGQHRAYLVCLVFSLTTDFLDGLLARVLKQTSELGAKLDSWADLATYLSVPIGAWWLWPEIVRQEGTWVLLGVGSYLLAVLVGWIKFRRLTSYHTWTGKAAAILLPISIVLLLSGVAGWVFRFIVPLVVAAAFEEIGITLVSPVWRSNVPSIWHALKLRD